MNIPVRDNIASMLRKSRIPVSNPSSDHHVSSARGSRSPAPLRTIGSRIPVINSNRSMQAPSSSPERYALPDFGIPNGKQVHKTEASAKGGLIRPSSFTVSPCPSPKPATTALATKLAPELDSRSLTISELEWELLHTENLASEQAVRLAESKSDLRAKDEAMIQLKSELLTARTDYDDLLLRLEETNHDLERATLNVNKHLKHSTFLESELKEARDTIASLQTHPDRDLITIRELQEKLSFANTEVEIHRQAEAQLREDVDRMQVQLEGQQQELTMRSDMIQSMQQGEQDFKGDLEKRNRLIVQVSNELAVRDEEFRNLFETLKFKQSKLRNQEHSISLLEQRNKRLRTKLEERNAALQKKIVRLKLNLRDYSQVIIGNNGKPFFEEIPTSNREDIACELVPSQEQQSQKHRNPSRRHN